ncbi:transcriptional regulator, CarD family [Aneurinibacillus thermoaerophilus]|uniref:Transcriptional regulator, CarD family n=2 Tax=Aneurinibacillus thermoaerophilus TaxID=143495 RepID=A0A1G8CUA1_ANETH|nr:transcriptional regulator, CarD family [Aneurinibacillus thermoaerophilus]
MLTKNGRYDILEMDTLLGVGLLFRIGDKIVYPMHGAGIIEAIEEKEILGEKQQYYIMKMPVGNMQIMIPMEKVKNLGIREVVDVQALERVMEILRHGELDTSMSWNRRYRKNMEKMRTGDIYEVADVVRELMRREKEKGLSTGERKMLDNARQILLSELVLVKNINEEQATDLLERVVNS